MNQIQEFRPTNTIQELIETNVSVSPVQKRARKSSTITFGPPKKMNRTNFETRLKNLLTQEEFGDIFYGKTVLDIHHVIVLNWKVFQYEILENQGLWGRSHCFSTFNREMLVQGYHKVKFQSSEHGQKVSI